MATHIKISAEDAATLLADLNRLFADMLVQEFAGSPIKLEVAEYAVEAVEKIVDTYVMAAVAANNAAA